MKLGAWFHDHDDLPLEGQLSSAAAVGIRSARSYSLEYARKLVKGLQQNQMSLLAGIHVDAEGLLEDWRSQFRPDLLEAYHSLGVALEGICIGNELREGGDAPDQKRFTARLAFGLANVMRASRHWLDDHGYTTTPLTYAIEEIVYDPALNFQEFMLPLIDACDIVSINAYPMGAEAWFTYSAFEESRRFLYDDRTRNDRLAAFDYRLRRALTQIEAAGKPALLSETGFPSATGYHLEGDRLVVPESDGERYGEVMVAFVGMLRQISQDYGGRLEGVYFYEWRDNLYHDKIWNVENSPIHTAFGLCDRYGQPKFDLRRLLPPAPVDGGDM
jgi:hypothetical protein